MTTRDDWTATAISASESQWKLDLSPADVQEFDGPDFDPADVRVPLAPERGKFLVAPNPGAERITSRILEILYDGPGVVLLTGAPTDDEDRAVAWLWNLGVSLGVPVPQTRDGDMIGRVEDAGAHADNPTHRGHQTAAELPFHADRTDVIALMCIRRSARGGGSRLASAQRLYDVLADEYPALLETLLQPMPHDRRGEEGRGEAGWCLLPVFSGNDGRMVCRYIRRFIESSQRHADAPRLSRQQLAAMDALDELLKRADIVANMDLEPGQVQLVENHKILHSRAAFEDSGEQRRLLLRLWLSTSRSPALPEEFLPIYGSTRPGVVRGGVWPENNTAALAHPIASK